MPCRDDREGYSEPSWPPPPAPRASASKMVKERDHKRVLSERDALRDRNDVLARENDMLRELILTVVDETGYKLDGTGEALEVIRTAQVAHRKSDLDRLRQTFLARLSVIGDDDLEYVERLGRVLKADPNEPLTAQLGFDPDAF